MITVYKKKWWEHRKYFSIDLLSEEERGKGYARVLMNEMLDRSRKLGFKEVTFTTKPEVMSVGYGLYKRMGFEEVNCTDGVASMRMTL